MNKSFIEFLTIQGYPKETIVEDYLFRHKINGHPCCVDVAIVVGGKVVQAFEIKQNAKQSYSIEQAPIQVSKYEDIFNSLKISADIHIVTTDGNVWWIYSKQNDTWQLAKDILFFKNASEEFVNKVKSVLSGADVEKLAYRCQRISLFGFIYIILYVVTYLAYSKGCCKCLLPLNWELLALFACVVIIWLLPSLLRITKKIKIRNVELEFVELEAHRLLKQNE